MEGLLIDPRASIEEAHRILDQLGNALMQANAIEDPRRRVQSGMTELQARLRLRTSIQ
jgi:hypothetical protein